MTLGDTGERRNAVLLVELCPFRWKAKPTQMNKGDKARNESGFRWFCQCDFARSLVEFREILNPR